MATKANQKLASSVVKEEVVVEVKPVFLGDQEHITFDGEKVTSHLLAIPKGFQFTPYQDRSMKGTFGLTPFGDDRKNRWGSISDRRITDRYPDHRVVWLCPAAYCPKEYARDECMINTKDYGDRPEPVKITYEVIFA